MVEFVTNPETPPRVDVDKREATFHGFLKFCGWTGLHVLLVAGYLTLVFGVGMNWLVALFLMAIAGGVGGWLMKLGSAWYFSLLAQAGIVLLARFFIFLFNLVS
ncbi:aa3-type cytochrome c oxidase subunit IV [Henriciella sp.]|uniref:aa3-type cytochrome c oxidase subunit IV n=1 Tax=Henriciella sp. TaxID=1968823 RepID=UPI002636BCD1|nr:aa3-type cytochrome c oxidase subunit IV [Henriciella sp.]